VRLTYQSVAHGTAQVRVDLASGEAHTTTTISVQLPAPTATTPAASEPPTATRPSASATAPAPDSFRLLLGGSALFLGLLASGLLVCRRPHVSLLATSRRPVRSTGLRDLKGRFELAMERTLERRGRHDALGMRLESAGVALRPGEYLALAASATGLGFFVGLLLGSVVIAIVFAALAIVAAAAVLRVRTTKRRAAFERQLPDLLQQLTSTLRVGYGMMQALDSVARETEAPLGDELRRVVNEVQLGRLLPESLEAMAERVGGEDFLWVVQAIEINAEVGGDLVEVLDAVAATIRARAHLRRQIKTLSAQGRLSARILLSMPFVMAVLLSLIHPGYLAPLVEPGIGPVLLTVGAGLMTVGTLWMRRIVRLRF
jgi:tight adherence protein B